MDTRKHFELDHVEVCRSAYTGKNRLLRSGGPVHVESELYHPLNYVLDVLLVGVVLHCYDHCVCPHPLVLKSESAAIGLAAEESASRR